MKNKRIVLVNFLKCRLFYSVPACLLLLTCGQVEDVRADVYYTTEFITHAQFDNWGSYHIINATVNNCTGKVTSVERVDYQELITRYYVAYYITRHDSETDEVLTQTVWSTYNAGEQFEMYTTGECAPQNGDLNLGPPGPVCN